MATSFLFVGCQSGYLIEQGSGQLGLIWGRVDLDDQELLASLEDDERRKLEWAPKILEFARTELGLDPGDSYTTFFDTKGEPITHLVVASERLALIPYEWCFPIVGCVPYKGYFDEDDADAEADRLREQGWDVSVLPASAYSTLGWFSDPVLSDMLDRPFPGFVDVLIHETVHRTLYLPGGTAFNESLATHVAREGTRLFLERHPESASEEDLEAWQRRQRFSRLYEESLARLRDDLDSLFRSDLPDVEKEARKAELLGTTKRTIERLLGRAGLPNLTNADVILSDRYHGYVEDFARIQRRVGGHPKNLLSYLARESSEGLARLEELLAEAREEGSPTIPR